MREIKFKVWDVDEEKWYNNERVPYQLIDNEGVFYWADDYEWNHYPGEVLIMQFTGLLDKNGTEIYEGDILKRGDFPDEQPRYIVRFGKFTDSHDMYYKQEYLGWYVDEIGEQDRYRNPLTYIVDMLDGVVCGNIYEHPHLLRGDND